MWIPIVIIASLTALAPGQTAQDVGMVVYDTNGPGSAGAFCKPVSCTPQYRIALLRGGRYGFRVYGDAQSLFAVAVAPVPTSNACARWSGFANDLALGSSFFLLGIGKTGGFQSGTTNCRVYDGQLQVTVPATAPPGVRIRVQSISASARSGTLAFGNLIDCTLQ